MKEGVSRVDLLVPSLENKFKLMFAAFLCPRRSRLVIITSILLSSEIHSFITCPQHQQFLEQRYSMWGMTIC